MLKIRIIALLLLSSVVTAAGCGEASEESQFKSGMEGAIAASEKGKELVKSPGSAKKAR